MTQNIDNILHDWPYESSNLSVRLTSGDDGRDVIQMRVDLGILQMEVTGRPDGTRPFDSESVYSYLQEKIRLDQDEFELTEEECAEIDREFVQFYHRRICWLKLHNYRNAAEDADHTIGLMDLCRECSPDEQWTLSHEQYRPFVMFHRIQARALALLEEEGPRTAVDHVDDGLEELRMLYSEHGLGDQFDQDDLVVRLREMRESLYEQCDPRLRLGRELAEAIAAEHFEEAARIRDELAKLDT